MKIAFLGQKGIPAHGGGVERYVEDLSVRMFKAGHEAIVYTRPNYTSKNKKKYKGVELVSLPSIKTKHLDTITHSVLASIDAMRKKVDIAHYQSIGPALICWLPKVFSKNIKVISTLQSRDYEHQKWGKFARVMLRVGEFFMCKFSDEVIVITEKMRKYVKNKYGVDAHVIPNGSNFYRNVQAISIKKWNLKKNNYIVAISRLVRHKGLHHLIRAYKDINTNKKLVIAGSGAFTDNYVLELKALAGGDNNIIFTGNQSGKVLDELYSNAYLFIQPSESEGLSLALLEAMSRGKAVLVSSILENKEVVEDSNFIFKNKSSNDLADKLEYLLKRSMLVKKNGKFNKIIIRKYYNWDSISKNILKIYKKAILDNKINKSLLGFKYKLKKVFG